MDQRPDYFNAYSSQMTKIHEDLFSIIQFDEDIDRNRIERILIQCNFKEYLEHHPEEPDYIFDLYDFNYQESSGQIMAAFNKNFFSTEESITQFRVKLKDTWKSNGRCYLNQVKVANSIHDLRLCDNDVMQSAHFLYPDLKFLKSKIDYQIFKVIYPYKTVKPVLKAWDKKY